MIQTVMPDVVGLRVTFDKIFANYQADFRPLTDPERDTVYCLATRWGIDRNRAAEDAARDVFHDHGYLPPKNPRRP